MKTVLPLVILLLMISTAFAQTSNWEKKVFLDKDGDMNALTWNATTGESILYARITTYERGRAFHQVRSQLPQKPFASGTTQMTPLLDKDGDLNVLVWNPETGESVMYARYTHSQAGFGFHKSVYQLPQKPFASGTTQMSACLDKDKDINVMVWNADTGESIFYAAFVHYEYGRGFHKTKHQLP